MNIYLLTEEYYHKYNEFILENEMNLFYLSLKYKSFLEDLLECKSQYLICLENNRIIGALPLMYKQGKFGKVYNSLPFYGSNGGIVANTHKVVNLLVKEYNKIVKADGVATSNLIAQPLLKADYSKIEFNESDERIGQFTPINYTNDIENKLMESYHYKTRNMIRKAIKSDIEIIIDNEQLDFLKEIHYENMQAIGGKPKSIEFFNLISEHFNAGKDYNIFVALKDKKPISALLLFYFNKTVEYFTPVIKVEYRSFQPLSLIIFNAMIDASRKKYKWWNWGGTWKTQEGVYRFKSRWNAKDYFYKYYNIINNKEIYNSSSEELLREYPNFYVLPFNKLNNENK